MIPDSGCDQLLLTFIWRAFHITGRYVQMTSPLHGHAAVPYPVANCAAKIIDRTGRAFCAIANEAL